MLGLSISPLSLLQNTPVLLIGLLACLNTACVPIPVNKPEPFKQEDIAPLSKDGATRATVERKLGKPARTNASRNLYLYYEFQLQAVLLVGGGYTGGALPVGRSHHLYVRFGDNGKVSSTRIVQNPVDYCLSNGSCLALNRDLDIWQAPAAETSTARAAKPIAGRCRAYVLDRSKGALAGLGEIVAPGRTLLIDGQEQMRFPARYAWEGVAGGGFKHFKEVNINTFYALTLRPGRHVLDYKPRQRRDNAVTTEARPFEFTCEAGEVVFIGPDLQKSENRSGALGLRNQIYTFQRLSRESALKLISKMQLLHFTG